MTCKRCNGGGFVQTKHGPVRCPFCNRARVATYTPDAYTWSDGALGATAYALLVLCAVVGHALVSGAWG